MSYEPALPLGDEAMTADDTPPADALFEALSQEYRRSTLSYLARTGGSVSLDELAGRVATQVGSSDEPGTTQARVATKLHHVHLPKMDDVGLVDYDADRNVVEPTEATMAVESASLLE